jgi:hypothetical protein
MEHETKYIAISYTHLGTVDKFSQGNIGMVAKDVDILEIGGAILELDAQEVADVRRGTTAEFNDHSRSVISCRSKS